MHIFNLKIGTSSDVMGSEILLVKPGTSCAGEHPNNPNYFISD